MPSRSSQIIMIANYISNYSENERIILLRKLDHLTTVYYPDEQISSYHTSLSTTPMTEVMYGENESSNPAHIELSQNGWHPTNHRIKHSEVYRSTDKTRQRNAKRPQKRMFFTDNNDDDDDDADDADDDDAGDGGGFNAYYDYIESPRHVNSIQDILAQGNGADMIQPSISYSRAAKIAGVYWRQKPSRSDPFQPMESNTNGRITKPTAVLRAANASDPFFRFKPSSPGDVNLLASANPLKLISQYKQHKPRPLTSAPNPFNKHASEYDATSEASAHMRYQYQDRINAGRTDKQIRKQARPFSLMLDVYPMPDEVGNSVGGEGGVAGQTMSATRPFSSFASPHYPVAVNAMSNRAQYSKHSPYYNHMKYAQLQPYRWPFFKSSSSYDSTSDSLYPPYILNHIQPNWYRIDSHTVPIPSQPMMAANEPAPSQITLHLNLFPTPNHSKKHYERSHIDSIDIDNNVLSTAETSIRRSVGIPPLSALTINALSLNASDGMLNASQLNDSEYQKLATHEHRFQSKGFTIDSDINQRLNAITSTTNSSFLDRADLITAMPTTSMTTDTPVTQPTEPFTLSIN